MHHYRGARLLFGDQTLFCRAADFKRVGGFAARLPIMEDADLCIRLHMAGPGVQEMQGQPSRKISATPAVVYSLLHGRALNLPAVCLAKHLHFHAWAECLVLSRRRTAVSLYFVAEPPLRRCEAGAETTGDRQEKSQRQEHFLSRWTRRRGKVIMVGHSMPTPPWPRGCDFPECLWNACPQLSRLTSFCRSEACWLRNMLQDFLNMRGKNRRSAYVGRLSGRGQARNQILMAGEVCAGYMVARCASCSFLLYLHDTMNGLHGHPHEAECMVRRS